MVDRPPLSGNGRSNGTCTSRATSVASSSAAVEHHQVDHVGQRRHQLHQPRQLGAAMRRQAIDVVDNDHEPRALLPQRVGELVAQREQVGAVHVPRHVTGERRRQRRQETCTQIVVLGVQPRVELEHDRAGRLGELAPHEVRDRRLAAARSAVQAQHHALGRRQRDRVGEVTRESEPADAVGRRIDQRLVGREHPLSRSGWHDRPIIAAAPNGSRSPASGRCEEPRELFAVCVDQRFRRVAGRVHTFPPAGLPSVP